MRARPLSKRAAAALLLIGLLLTACRGGGTDPDPTPPPPPDPRDPAPFSLVIDNIVMAPMDNGEITGAGARPADKATAEQAVEATRSALERYLNGQFIQASTRFGGGPARELLKPGLFDTLPEQQRAVLGVSDLPVAGVVTGPARGTATVLFEDGKTYGVAIDYEAHLTVFFADPDASESSEAPPLVSDAPMTQRGSVLFTAPSWGVESFELTLDAPPAPAPAASPTAGASRTVVAA